MNIIVQIGDFILFMLMLWGLEYLLPTDGRLVDYDEIYNRTQTINIALISLLLVGSVVLFIEGEI